MKKEERCSICGGIIKKEESGWDGGHNAEPINSGRCCVFCNDTVVFKRRINDHYRRQDEEMGKRLKEDY